MGAVLREIREKLLVSNNLVSHCGYVEQKKSVSRERNDIVRTGLGILSLLLSLNYVEHRMSPPNPCTGYQSAEGFGNRWHCDMSEATMKMMC